MKLSTFGAVLAFAMDFEQRAESYYQEAAEIAYPDIFSSFAKGSKKRYSRLERARRECISEMILEPLIGLSVEKFQIELKTGLVLDEILDQANKLEESQSRFYRSTAEKLPIKEVERIFLRFAAENEKRRAKLQALEI